MAEIISQDPRQLHDDGDDLTPQDARPIKRPRAGADDDDEDEKPGRERRKIEIKFIQDKSRRHITFSKRKAGIMKKAYELSVLTGTQVLLLVVSETGLVYTFTTPKLQPLVTKPEGKNLIQACLNAPEPETNGVDEHVDSPADEHHNPSSAAPQMAPQMRSQPPPYMTPDQQQALQYQAYMQHQHASHQQGTYPIPPTQGLHQPR
ncbi:SRF-TF-domain-containing protein [Piedraia hortae CBS 480.64]|uniref:SRF-TF-domain-containing protein n=1 Tax=Piedraia hortae CBS 480.64 TaxID=1314780 RepID=A0A6A7BZY7_9PEZI|nr:SRF-TF-domain-containing protein [Piedraia hortae CBS 480.64]